MQNIPLEAGTDLDYLNVSESKALMKMIHLNDDSRSPISLANTKPLTEKILSKFLFLKQDQLEILFLHRDIFLRVGLRTFQMNKLVANN